MRVGLIGEHKEHVEVYEVAAIQCNGMYIGVFEASDECALHILRREGERSFFVQKGITRKGDALIIEEKESR